MSYSLYCQHRESLSDLIHEPVKLAISFHSSGVIKSEEERLISDDTSTSSSRERTAQLLSVVGSRLQSNPELLATIVRVLSDHDATHWIAMQMARNGQVPVPPESAIKMAVRENASCMRSAISSEKLRDLIPVLFGSGVLQYKEYQRLNDSRGHLPTADIVERVAIAVESWIKSHCLRLDSVLNAVKKFKSFHSVIVWIKNDYEMRIQGEPSLEFSRGLKHLSGASLERTMSAEGKSVSLESTVDKFSILHRDFDDTFAQVKAIVCKHVPLKRLKEQIGCQWLSMDDEERVQTTDQLMESFWRQACTFPHLHELEKLVDALGIGNAKRIVAQYEQMRVNVYRETLVEDFAKLSAEEHYHDKNVKVEFVVAWSKKKATLREFEDFLRSVFGFLHEHVNLRDIHGQLLTFVCSTPFFSASALTRMVREKARLLGELSVLSVTIDCNVVFRADAGQTPPMDTRNGVKDLDSLRQDLKELMREEVRRELREELRDEVEEVQYDEVPLKGAAAISNRLRRLQDGIHLLIEEINTRTDLEEVEPQSLKLLQSKLKQASTLVVSCAHQLESPEKDISWGERNGIGKENMRMNRSISLVSSQEGTLDSKWRKTRSPSQSSYMELQTLASDLKDVVQWFAFGLFLGLPAHKLERVRQNVDVGGSGLPEVLELWLNGGPGDHGDVITALQCCGLANLAQGLAEKYGVVLLDDGSPAQSPTLAENTGLASMGFDAKDRDVVAKTCEVEEREKRVSLCEKQVRELEGRSKELAEKLQVLSTSLDDAEERSKVLYDQHKELNLQLGKKRLERNFLCKQGSSKQLAIKQLTETELSIKASIDRLSKIEANTEQHERCKKELREKRQKLEAELKKEIVELHQAKKQLLQRKASLERVSRQFDDHLQQLVSQQSSTMDADKLCKISRHKKALPRHHASCTTSNSGQSRAGGMRVVRTVPMDRHLAELHQRLQQDIAVNGRPGFAETGSNNLCPEYYYEDLTTLDAERILTQEKNFVGMFLVWSDVERTGHDTILSVLGRDRVHHAIIPHEIVDCYPTAESFVKFFKETPNEVEHRPVVACFRANRIKDLEAPETCVIELDQHVRENRLTNMWTGFFGEQRQKVLIKSMKRGHSSTCQFQSEAVIMKDLLHANILGVKAYVTGQQPYIITEPVVHASLHHYFIRYKFREAEIPSLVNIASQVASGMAYLESLKCIHRNLAARNVMLAGQGAKIANFSQACYTPSGRFTCDPGLILLRWTAPEVLSEGTFSSKSDVWSFGVLLWEMFTHGDLPYSKMKDDNVREKVKAGYHLAKPKHCPQEIYSMMTECWMSVPDERPQFSKLASKLTDHKRGSNSYYTIVY